MVFNFTSISVVVNQVTLLTFLAPAVSQLALVHHRSAVKQLLIMSAPGTLYLTLKKSLHATVALTALLAHPTQSVIQRTAIILATASAQSAWLSISMALAFLLLLQTQLK